eukprot:TRINITY_DN7499_c0_g1_i3.p1 TRINITY_DN7499_c0_g1~~TRINITY_DN7499_c0_g1_i3.p1  ORF type:complete len:267 (+),score=-0.02 TRINITY_DN7499_c0_g1_i3:179-979(+)
MEVIKSINLTSSIFYLLGEIFCTVTTVKCFSIPRFRTGLPLIAIYACFHIVLIANCLILLGDHIKFLADKKIFQGLNYTSSILKGFFLLIFTSRILGVVACWEEKNKLPHIIIKVIWIFLPLHLGGFLLVAFCTKHDSRKLALYLGFVDIFIASLYLYACVKIIPHLRNSYVYAGNDYLRWLFIIIIYMFFAFLFKIFFNISQFFDLQSTISNTNKILLTLYFKAASFITALIPIMLMSYCLFKLAVQEGSAAVDESDLSSLQADC